jgi:hypothetical protein
MRTEAELKAIILTRKGSNVVTASDIGRDVASLISAGDMQKREDALNAFVQLKVDAATASLQDEINLLNRALKRYTVDES